ncbi:hypothetical protein KSD_06260 [Ktedonobacter sp. SOSP1-85]|nr:hypothetical protein KSD_06260 [Ktedonobacter sp. SOSP1-85]
MTRMDLIRERQRREMPKTLRIPLYMSKESKWSETLVSIFLTPFLWQKKNRIAGIDILPMAKARGFLESPLGFPASLSLA